MNGRIIFRVLLALVLLAAVAAVGVYAYNAGVARGLAENVALAPPGEDGVPALPYAYGYGAPYFFHRPFFGYGFGPLGCLFPLLILFLVFGLMRGIFWGGSWGRGWGWRHYGPGEKGLPPMFEEWHRRAHGEPAQPTEK
jgi:hypothetical protein